ncbi:NfeD family protein [Salinispirillum sp. LH 10-3-1]|uniref:NfeD family protein n=1 Tax=Salinispirillum sp. LH 10-3-1 TaxID=2952525 RepID=A0AB38YK05_9GAMM
MIWIIVGVLLILSELMATSIVAVFLGIGAIVTGVLLYFGVIESFTAQAIVFGVVSLSSLIVARKRFKTIFGGFTADAGEQSTQFQRDIGERVTVLADFEQGAGRVTLNGVAWNAESSDDLKAGEVAWVIANEGINLTVSRKAP